MTQYILENLKTNIWDEKLTAELNYRCYFKLAEETTLVDSILKYTLALISISTVVFWTWVDPSGNWWKWLSAISAVLASINAAYRYQNKIESIVKVKSCYHKIWKDFDELWLRIISNEIALDETLIIRKKLLDAICEIDKIDNIHRINKQTIKICQKEVLTHNKLRGQ